METMPMALTKRNGYIVRNGLKIFRGGLGEFVICNAADVGIAVCRSYGAAMAYTNGYAQGVNDFIDAGKAPVPYPPGDREC